NHKELCAARTYSAVDYRSISEEPSRPIGTIRCPLGTHLRICCFNSFITEGRSLHEQEAFSSRLSTTYFVKLPDVNRHCDEVAWPDSFILDQIRSWNRVGSVASW
ncbi:hypothetical protein GOODEAATRI_032752, partial [Goodea atripinnis]